MKNPKPSHDFTILQRAGITQAEYGAQAGVSRITVNLWVNGTHNPNIYLQPGVKRLNRALEAAVKAGALPLPSTVGRMDRAVEISRAVAAHTHDVQAMPVGMFAPAVPTAAPTAAPTAG